MLVPVTAEMELEFSRIQVSHFIILVDVLSDERRIKVVSVEVISNAMFYNFFLNWDLY